MNAPQRERRGRGWPMQAWVAALVIAVTLPMGALVFLNARQDAREEEQAAAEHAELLARQLAAATARFLADTHTLLERLKTRPAIRMKDPDACDPLFGEFAAHFPRYASLRRIDRNGEGVCASDEILTGPHAYAGLPGFRAVAAGERFHVGAPLRDPGSQRWVGDAAIPLFDDAGTFDGALAIAIDLQTLPQALFDTKLLPRGSTVELVQRESRYVARSSEPDDIGGEAPGALVEAAVRGDLSMHVDVKGVGYQAGLAPVLDVPWFAVARVPAEVSRAATHQRLQRALAIAAVVLLAVWGVSAYAMRRIVRPLDAIARAATAVAGGDTQARVQGGGPREIDEIATAFNRMLDQRAHADLALKASEVRYRSLFETSSDAIIGMSADNTILFANPAAESLTGWRPDELVGRNLAMLQPADLRELHVNAMRRLAADPTASPRRRSTETRCLHRDGHEIPVEITFSAADNDGERFYVGFIRDITQRQTALAELRESERRFREMADTSPVLIWTADAVVREFYFNARWLEFTGQTTDEARAAGWFGGVHPDDVPAVQEVIDRANVHNEGCTLEYRRLRYDGEYRWMLDRSAPRLDEHGRFLGYVGTAVDIHDRVVGEGRIRRLTTLYSALSQANEAIARSDDLVTLLQTICDIVVRQTGIATAVVSLLDATEGKLIDVAYAGDFAHAFSRFPLQVRAAPPGEESPGSLVLRTNRRHVSADRHADTTVWQMIPAEAREALRSSAVYPLQRDGHAVGVLAVYAREIAFFDDELTELLDLLARDISYALESFAARDRRDLAEGELKRLNATLEERVAERTRSLEAANRELEAFSYSVSHDLRAPLRGISGFSALLHEHHAQQLGETGQGYLERVGAAAAKMTRLIDDLLDLSRIARQAIRRADVDISALVREIVDELSEAASGRRVDVSIEPGMRATADPGLARIVFYNLLDNAWKFTSRSAQARIDVSSATIDGHAGFTVRDNGAGFDPVYAEKLFAPFQRLHGEHEFPGTGIGLAIVQRIVHRHGGEIRALAAAGEGAAFTFSFGG